MHGGNVNATDNILNTALHIAALNSKCNKFKYTKMSRL